MKSLSKYTKKQQEMIISNFMDSEYGNDEYDSDDAILHFKEEVDILVDEFEEMVGENNLELSVTDFENHQWELSGEIGFLADYGEDEFVEVSISPTSVVGDMEVQFNIYFPQNMSKKDADEIEDELEWPLISLTDSINEFADEYGWKAAYGCDINDKDSVRAFLKKNEQGINLDDYL